MALKLLRAEYASNASSAQRFLNEARLVRAVQHPAVVSLHRFGRTDDGTLLIDMELVDGEAVRDRVMRLGHGLEPALAMQILDNLLAALVDNHVARRKSPAIDPASIVWRRCLDVCDRSLRIVNTGVTDGAGWLARTTGFDLTAASEIMAILALATSLPMCWNCHVAESFRRLHPELVTDRDDRIR